MSFLKRMRKLGWYARYDVRRDIPQVKFPNSDWIGGSGGYEYALLSRFRESNAFPEIRSATTLWKSLYLSVRADHSLHYDPLKHWLKTRPEWDGNARLGYLLSTLYEVDDEHTQSVSYYMCLAPIVRCYHPGEEVLRIPVLISHTVWHSFNDLISDLPPRFASSSQRQVKAKESDEYEFWSMFESALLESPVRDMTDSKSEKLRNFLFRTEDNVKLPYRPMQSYPRRTSFVLTGSDERVPRGIKRIKGYVPIFAVRDDRNHTAKYIEDNRDQLWAEGLAIYRRGDHKHLCEGYFER